MTLLKNKNFAFSLLAGNLLIGGTSLDVTTGEGTKFANTGSFMGVLWGSAYAAPGLDSTAELVKATFVSGDNFTITRAQEGTSAKAWSTGDNFASVITAGKLDELETYLQNDELSYGIATGTNTLAATLDPALTAYATGVRLTIKFVNASTGAVTLNVNGLGAKKVYSKKNGVYTALDSGDIFAAMYGTVVYDADLDASAGGWHFMELDLNTVQLTGAQTIAGVKTFSSSPIVPTPTTDMQTSTKKYVDDYSARTATLTNKTIDAEGTGNSITNIKDSNIKAAAAINANKLGNGDITNTILSYLNTVTSNIQTQIDNAGFYSGYAKFSDVKATGTAGGSTVATTRNTRTLNTTIHNTISGASRSGNAVTLPAGTYRIIASAPGFNGVGGHRLIWRNTSDSTDEVLGQNHYSPASSVNVAALLQGRFTIAASKTFNLQHYTASAVATNGLGLAVNQSGVSEIYAVVEIWKEK